MRIGYGKLKKIVIVSSFLQDDCSWCLQYLALRARGSTWDNNNLLISNLHNIRIGNSKERNPYI